MNPLLFLPHLENYFEKRLDLTIMGRFRVYM